MRFPRENVVRSMCGIRRMKVFPFLSASALPFLPTSYSSKILDISFNPPLYTFLSHYFNVRTLLHIFLCWQMFVCILYIRNVQFCRNFTPFYLFSPLNFFSNSFFCLNNDAWKLLQVGWKKWNHAGTQRKQFVQ